MGILNFLPWVRKVTGDYIDVFTNERPLNVDNFFMDANGIIYDNYSKIYSKYPTEVASGKSYVKNVDIDTQGLEDELIEAVYDAILRVVNFVAPTKMFVLCFDGCPPMAKIKQQKESRHLAMVNSKRTFDTNQISPGTRFMTRLCERIRERFEDAEEGLPPLVYYLDHLVPGEGEHKIFKLLRGGLVKKSSRSVIYGMDSDLVILSMLSEFDIRLLRMFVPKWDQWKDGQTYYKINNIKTRVEVLNLPLFRELIYKKLDSTVSLPQTATIKKIKVQGKGVKEKRIRVKVRSDSDGEIDTNRMFRILPAFALISFFVGNDFIPISPEFGDITNGSLDILCELYRNSGETPIIDSRGRVNQSRVVKFFEAVLINEMNPETSMLAKHAEVNPENMIYQRYISNLRVKTGTKSGGKKSGGIKAAQTGFRNAWYTAALRPWTLRDPKDFINPGVISNMANSYYSMMLWNIRYYRFGDDGINKFFFYPYNFAPLLLDVWCIAKMAAESNFKIFPINSSTLADRDNLGDDDLDYGPFEQLAMILPSVSGYIIRDLDTVNSSALYATGSLLAPYYPSTFMVENDYTGNSFMDDEIHDLTIRKHIFIPPPSIRALKVVMEVKNIHPVERISENGIVEFKYRKMPAIVSEAVAEKYRGPKNPKKIFPPSDNSSDRNRKKRDIDDTNKVDEVIQILGDVIKTYRQSYSNGGVFGRDTSRLVWSDKVVRI